MGSLFLIALYLYAVTFPPPLSPNPHPEDVDIAGIVDKSLEVILVIGIVFLMRYEKNATCTASNPLVLKKSRIGERDNSEWLTFFQ